MMILIDLYSDVLFDDYEVKKVRCEIKFNKI